jgi:hypothetical protein
MKVLHLPRSLKNMVFIPKNENITLLFTLTFHMFIYIIHAFTSYKCVGLEVV